MLQGPARPQAIPWPNNQKRRQLLSKGFGILIQRTCSFPPALLPRKAYITFIPSPWFDIFAAYVPMAWSSKLWPQMNETQVGLGTYGLTFEGSFGHIWMKHKWERVVELWLCE